MAEPVKELPVGRAWAFAALALLAPGLAHWRLGKKRHGAVFFGVVCLTFLYGVLLDGRLFSLHDPNFLFRLGGFVQLCLGPAAWLAKGAGLGSGEITSVYFGYGSTFIVSAGLMNALLMMDAFDIVIGRKKTPEGG